MEPDPDNLANLADDVLEGRPLDWQELESSAGAETRGLISQFRTIARIADVRRRVANDPPKWWGHLKIEERLGAGAFGEVFRAWDSRLEREVALKLLSSDRDPAAVLREARLLARIRHPNIVTVFDAAEFEGRAGFWMEFLQGQTLEEGVHNRGPLPAPEVLKLAIELCGALDAVHAAGLLHRDIKAQNVVRTADGRVVLMDFGAGDELSAIEPLSQQSVGTPLYLAPEILSGSAATTKSEIYSLGVLLFRVATGSYPVPGVTIEELRTLHNQGIRKRLLEAIPAFPSRLAGVIDRALESDPGARFENAHAMGIALTDGASMPQWIDRPSNRRWLLVAAGAMIVTGIALVGWLVQPTPPSVAPAVSESIPRTTAGLDPPRLPPESQATIQVMSGNDTMASGSLPTTGSPVTLQMIDGDIQRRFNFRALADDGVHATCTPWGGSAVAICELATGNIRELRRPVAPNERSAHSMLSPDGSQVAYHWTDATGASLRVMEADGTGDRELFRPPAGLGFGLMKWIRDGRSVLLTVAEGPGKGRRYIAVTIDGGRTEQVWRFDDPNSRMDLSPDERFVLFSRPAADQTTSDIAIVDKRTGKESWLVQDPSDDSKPMWTSDGRAVVFMSERLGTSGLFLVPVREGRAAGDVVLVRDFGRSSVVPLNLARDGTLFVKMTTHWSDAFRATVDLEKGVIGTPVRLDTRSIEETVSPDWRPDGLRYAYVSGPMGRALSTNARLIVRHADGRLDREVQLEEPLNTGAWLRWSPDGRHIAVRTSGDDASGSVHLLDLETDTSRLLLRGVTNGFKWNSDGSALFYSDGRQILRHDIATAVTTTVLNGSFRFDVSPRDGSIAVMLPLNRCTVWVLAPGETISVKAARATLTDQCWAIGWSRDGQKLLVSTEKQFPPVGLWVIDAVAGDPIRMTVPVEVIHAMSLRPGNRELLFSAGNPAPEFWTLRGISSARGPNAAAPTPAVQASPLK